ncbi:MAG: hypothetical protein JRN26_02845 [Nitrososphaerota archaeon]|jgi:hypothetical protein|nr:hypothetical protein [Nitrososphaerota archaeon]MDG6927492.1 hypothetical protein [Nitrososphaerota archaeon]MDG6931553.1 hypothetical protein [Nitrososphaerota archaeon]MDG6935812.1 hypothetical protein [Nitrososphaerota archaeon]MDG6943471.1 hypothetical protein [Nitrososphaerota archaeon]
MKLAPSTELNAESAIGPNIFNEFEMSVSDIRTRLVVELFVANLIRQEYEVNYIIGPN